ncbi:MAG: phytanoyl-CoA hydroxylase [Granulosicoccus sp.]|jgi:phytanoyl-CoA hydroxylase
MLDQSQIEHFEEQGYLVVPNLLDSGLLDDIKNEYTEKLRSLCVAWSSTGKLATDVLDMNFDAQLQAVIDAGLDYFQPLDISWPISEFPDNTPIHLGENVFRMIRNERTLDIIESLIGPEITSNPIQHVRIKPPLSDVAVGESRAHIVGTDWHQDRAVAREEADNTRMVTVWIAVTDATLTNGCLQVIPRSHKKDMQTHCPAAQLGIPHNKIALNEATPLPVEAGDAIIFHPLTVHGSRENHSRSIRWSFDLRYNATGDPTGRPQFPEFVARSRNAPHSELHDYNTWFELWMTTKRKYADLYQDPLSYHRWDGASSSCA